MSDIDLAAIRARAEEDTRTPHGLRDPWAALAQSAHDVPALLALVDAQAARIDKALATCSKYQAAADVVVHPVRADAWRVLSDHVRRALTEDAQ